MSEKEKAEEYYDAVADEYDEREEEQYFVLINELMWSQIREAFAQIKGGKILDAGGGTGKWSILLAKEGFRVTLIDISEKMIQSAREKAERLKIADRMIFKKGDLKNLEFEDESFDAVLCEGEVLSCIDHNLKDQVVGELTRVLKKGGKLMLSAGNRYFFSLYFMRDSLEKSRDMLTALTVQAPDNPTSPLYSRDELEKLLKKHGVAVDKVSGVGVLTLFYLEHLRKKTLEKEELRHLKELEHVLSQIEGIREIAPSIRIIGTKK